MDKKQNKSKKRNFWNGHINKIDSLVQLFDDTYEVYKVEFVMILKKKRKKIFTSFVFLLKRKGKAHKEV